MQADTAGDAITILLENGMSHSAVLLIGHLAELTPKEQVHNRDKDCKLCNLTEAA